MTEQDFNQVLNQNPKIAEFCKAFGLVRDAEYYEHPDREKERKQAQYDRGVILAKKYLGSCFMRKSDLLQSLEKEFPEKSQVVLNYWLHYKIANICFATFGTKKQITEEIIFLSNC